MKIIATAGLIALALSTSAAFAGPTIKVESSIGPVMAAAKTSMTLYTFQKDSKGVSNCYDNCAVNWPPFTAGSAAKEDGSLGIISRKDGTKQWAFDGKPLYFWVGDQAKGDVSGDGVGGVWDAVRQ